MTSGNSNSNSNGSTSSSARQSQIEACLRRLPHLKDGVRNFLVVSSRHKELHPAIISAILCRPLVERRALLDGVLEAVSDDKDSAVGSATDLSTSSSRTPGLGPGQGLGRRRRDAILAMDQDDVAVNKRFRVIAPEDYDKKWADSSMDSGRSASTIKAKSLSASDVEGDRDLEDGSAATLEISKQLQQAVDVNLERWQRTRELVHWQRFQEARRLADELQHTLGRGRAATASADPVPPETEQEMKPKVPDDKEVSALSSRLSRSAKVRDDKAPSQPQPQPQTLPLSPIKMSRRWRQLQEEKKLHEARLSELTRRRERMRWRRQYDEQTRAYQRELAQAELRAELERLDQLQQVRRAEHAKRIQQLMRELQQDELQDPKSPPRAPVPAPAADHHHDDGEFTHRWDDFGMWKDIVDLDDELEPVRESCVPPRTTLGAVENKENVADPRLHLPLQQPRAPSTAAKRPEKSSASRGKRGIAYQERKKWFEQALLAWGSGTQDHGLHGGSSDEMESVHSAGGELGWEREWKGREERPGSGGLAVGAPSGVGAPPLWYQSWDAWRYDETDARDNWPRGSSGWF